MRERERETEREIWKREIERSKYATSEKNKKDEEKIKTWR